MSSEEWTKLLKWNFDSHLQFVALGSDFIVKNLKMFAVKMKLLKKCLKYVEISRHLIERKKDKENMLLFSIFGEARWPHG